MAMYLCRFPNGDFSIVSAATKEEAVILLDEWGNAEQASLKRMPEFMMDFRLRDDGQIELREVYTAPAQPEFGPQGGLGAGPVPVSRFETPSGALAFSNRLAGKRPIPPC